MNWHSINADCGRFLTPIEVRIFANRHRSPPDLLSMMREDRFETVRGADALGRVDGRGHRV